MKSKMLKTIVKSDNLSDSGTSEKRRIIKLFETGFFHIFGGNVINKIISFMSGVVLVRILTKTEYGRLTYSWNIYGLLLIISGLGMDSAALQLASERSKDTDYCKKIVSFGTRLGLRVNAVICVVLLFVGLFVDFKIKGAGTLLVMLCLLPLFQLVLTMNNVFLRAQKRNREFSKLLLINTIAVFVFSVILSVFFRERGMVVANYIASIITLGVSFFHFKVTLISKNAELSADEKKSLLRIALISMLNNGLSQLMYLLDIFVLGIVDPNETILASYKIATTIPAALIFIPSSLVIYIYPYFAEHRKDKNWCVKHYRMILLYFGLFNLLISTIMFLFAPSIVRIVFGAQYSDSVLVFRILAVNYFFSGTFRTISGNLLVTQRQLKFNLITVIITSVCNVVADFFFVREWGSMGAATATVLVTLISSIMTTFYLLCVFKHIPEKEAELSSV